MIRPLPLRRFIGTAAAIVVLVPLAVGAATWQGVAITQRMSLDSRISAAKALLRNGRGEYGSASWQRSADRRLRQLSIAAIVLANTGSRKSPLIYQSTGVTKNAIKTAVAAPVGPSRITVSLKDTSGGRLSASLIFQPTSTGTRWLAGAIAAASALLTCLVGGFLLLGRWVIRSLHDLSMLVDEIAGGDPPNPFSPSPVLEIANVADGISDMGARLVLSNQEAAADDDERRFLLAALAHDLRTPLFALRGYLDGHERGVPGSRHYLARAREKADYMSRLISDLFSFARLEYAGLASSGSDIALDQLLRGCAATYSALGEPSAVHFAVVGGAPVTVRADAAALERIVTNLLENALRHSPPGETVTITYQTCRDHARFSVIDRGPGIPDDLLDRIFEPLFRIDDARTSASGGAGLGLAIAARLIRAHGGALCAHNNETGGATFEASFPLAHAYPHAPATSARTRT